MTDLNWQVTTTRAVHSLGFGRGAELRHSLTHVSVDRVIAEIETFEQVASRTAVKLGAPPATWTRTLVAL